MPHLSIKSTWNSVFFSLTEFLVAVSPHIHCAKRILLALTTAALDELADLEENRFAPAKIWP